MDNSAGSLSLGSRVALVTGAARGIGRAIALTLAAYGADVVVTDIDDDVGLLREVSTEVERLGRRSYAHTADIAIKVEVDRLVQASLARLGRIDVLVNNAGVHLYPSPLLSVQEAEWDRVLAINLKGPLFVSQAVLPSMIDRGAGVIVNVASDSAFDVIPDEGLYGISKIALVRLTAYFAKELSGKGVRVNSVAPGWVRTRLTEQFMTEPSSLDALLSGVPCRRVAEPQDIAGVVAFLASDLSSYVNGHCIVVDGGRIAGIPA
jgi:NAD(P)-dependent dehydrogenase (short-subunit alcohol dehydrogenase family)